MFYFVSETIGAFVFGDIDCCRLKQTNGHALYLYLYFVYDATGAVVELVVVG